MPTATACLISTFWNAGSPTHWPSCASWREWTSRTPGETRSRGRGQVALFSGDFSRAYFVRDAKPLGSQAVDFSPSAGQPFRAEPVDLRALAQVEVIDPSCREPRVKAPGKLDRSPFANVRRRVNSGGSFLHSSLLPRIRPP